MSYQNIIKYFSNEEINDFREAFLIFDKGIKK